MAFFFSIISLPLRGKGDHFGEMVDEVKESEEL